MVAGLGVPAVFVAFLFAGGWVAEIARQASPLGETPKVFIPLGILVLLGPVAAGAAAVGTVPARALKGGRPSFRPAYLSHLGGMLLFIIALFSGGNMQIWMFSLLLVVGAVGTLVVGGRRPEALGRLLLASTGIIVLSVAGDLTLEAVDPGFGYWTYLGLSLFVPGVVTWVGLVALVLPGVASADAG